MNKILLISYFYPPCNLTAAQRLGSWVKYLPENGYYPIVVTRNWTGKELTEVQRLENSGQVERVVKTESSEIHYLPYTSSLRDYFYLKSSRKPVFKYISKVFTFTSIFLRHFTLKAIPFRNMYLSAKDILLQNPDLEIVLISANPFEQFFFGYRLKKEFPQIKWVADYRDDWTTSEIDRPLFRRLQQHFEQKWVGTAAKIISVSPHYTSKISHFTGVPGETIYNGYDMIELTPQTQTNPIFTITYSGTLYATQPIGIFLEGLKKLINRYPESSIIINFPGLKMDETQAKRVESMMMGFENYISMSDRIPKNDIIELQRKSDVLLMVAHKGIKGIPSSKVFEYIGLQKQFVVCPGDYDVLDEIANTSQLGTVLNTPKDVFCYLEQRLEEKRTGKGQKKIPHDVIEQFSVTHQVKKLSTILNQLS